MLRLLSLLLLCCSCSIAAEPSIVTSNLPPAALGWPYSAQLQGVVGTPPAHWMIDEAMVFKGFAMDPSTGLLSGTPKVGLKDVSFYVTVRLTDGQGQSVTKGLWISILPRAELSLDPNMPTATIGVPYEANIPAFSAVSVSIVDGTLPPGLSMDSKGKIQGTPTQTGVYWITAKAFGAVGDYMSARYAIFVRTLPPLVLDIKPSYTFVLGKPAAIDWQPQGGIYPHNVIVTGQVPDGMRVFERPYGLAGTPTRAGVYNLTVTATDAANQRKQVNTVVNVVSPVSVTQSTLATARVNSSYTEALNASGGIPPYTWQLSGSNLPGGLSLSSAGEISGVITSTPGQFTFTVVVTDSTRATASATLSITVISGLAITTSTLPAGQAGREYSTTLAATGGTPPYTWTASGLPAGLSLNPTTGSITGTPSAAGQFTIALRVNDSRSATGSASLNLVVNAAPLLFSTQTLSNANVGTPYRATVVASGGSPPYQFSLQSGKPPEGIALSSAGELTGTPTVPGSWSFQVRVTDSRQSSMSGNVSLTVAGRIPQINPGGISNAASFATGLAPGGYFSIFGRDLAITAAQAQRLPLDTSLEGVTVRWNGKPVPLLFVTPGQINAQAPFDAPPGHVDLNISAPVQGSDTAATAFISATVQAAAPGLFSLIESRLLAINQDGKFNSPEHPAAPGSIVVFYATGCGVYDLPLRAGDQAPTDRLYRLALPHEVAIGDRAAEVLFAGAAPGQGTGLVQFNVRVPEIAAGLQPVRLTVGGVSGNTLQMFVAAR